MTRFVAVDWGTTNRRAYVIEDGAVLSTERDEYGVANVAEDAFEGEIDALQRRYAGLPLLLAGMIGSTRGWIDAGYAPAPAGIDALAAAVVRPRDGVAIIPGISRNDGRRADVMRGEEVQLLGAVAAGLAPDDGLLCQPGTHCKWARMVDGHVGDFVTAMTGEMFSLLKNHALIGREMIAIPADDDAFAGGVAASAEGDLLGALFGVRPASLLGVRPPVEAGSWVSGLLIGTDCRAHTSAGETVHLLADGAIATLYARALALCGAQSTAVDSHAAFVAGVTRIQERIA